jgi:hypothetical protein
MLHKNQSHKRNAWKYATILPTLVGFMLLFQIETIAQVKENSKVAAYAVEVEFSHIVTSKTTNSEIKEIENIFNEDNTLKISNIKRNKEGEIIEIKLEFSSKNNSKYKNIKIVKGDRPIKPIRIFIKEDKNNKKGVGFEEVSNVVSGKYVEVEETAEVEKDTNNYTIDNLVKNGKKVNIIVNGKLQTATIKSKIPLDQEIDIFEELDEKQLKSKYNIDKKEGETYYEITTKKEAPNKDESKVVSRSLGVSYQSETSKPKNAIEDAEILLNNKVISKEDLNKLDKNEIESINIKNNNGKRSIEIQKKNAKTIGDNSLKEVRYVEGTDEVKEELTKAKIELEKAKAEIEKAKAEIEKLKSNNKN